jgi:hypothetical protein
MKTFEFASPSTGPNATKRRVGLPGLYGSALRAASRASISARRFLSRRICHSRISRPALLSTGVASSSRW